VQARAAGKLTGAKFGSYVSLFGEARWRKPALVGMLLCVSGVVGLWGIGFFSPELVGDVIERSLRQAGVAPEHFAASKTKWIGVNMMVQNIGAFFGMLLFTKAAQRWGRKPAFAGAFLAVPVTAMLLSLVDIYGHRHQLLPAVERSVEQIEYRPQPPPAASTEADGS